MDPSDCISGGRILKGAAQDDVETPTIAFATIQYEAEWSCPRRATSSLPVPRDVFPETPKLWSA